jgi:hypothetical protein
MNRIYWRWVLSPWPIWWAIERAAAVVWFCLSIELMNSWRSELVVTLRPKAVKKTDDFQDEKPESE